MCGPQLLKLKDLLGAAFDLNAFDMLLLGLDRNLAHYASANDSLPVAMLRTRLA